MSFENWSMDQYLKWHHRNPRQPLPDNVRVFGMKQSIDDGPDFIEFDPYDVDLLGRTPDECLTGESVFAEKPPSEDADDPEWKTEGEEPPTDTKHGQVREG